MSFSLRLAVLILAALGVTACQTTGAVETRYETVEVAVRAPCPDEETYNAVMAARPVPIRDQAIPRPETPEGELAIVKPQLGRYEAPGAFADQASAALTSCRERQPLDPP